MQVMRGKKKMQAGAEQCWTVQVQLEKIDPQAVVIWLPDGANRRSRKEVVGRCSGRRSQVAAAACRWLREMPKCGSAQTGAAAQTAVK